MSRRALAAVLLALPVAACSVEPPVPVEEDPACAALRIADGEAPTIAVAPARLSYRGEARTAWRAWRPGPIHAGDPQVRPDAAAVDSAAVALGDLSTCYPFRAGVLPPAADVPRPEPALAPREYAWSRPDLDGAELARRARAVLAWSLGRHAPELGASHEQDPAVEARRLRAEAEERGATLLLSLDVREARVAFVKRDGLLWWFDAFMFWVPGVYPIVLVPDEVFEVTLRARVDLVHVRSGTSILSGDLVATHAQALNEPQRGWSLAGALYLDPYFLDEDDFRAVHAALGPHAQRELERGLAEWLRAELPARLADPEVRELLRMGDPAQARAYALVIGSPGPATEDIDRPRPLRSAVPDADADAVAALLRETGTHAVERLVDPTAAEALEAVERLGARMLGHDRLLVYYSGYGRTDGDGAPALLLRGGEPLPLARLGDALREAVPTRSEVGLLLDASFGGVGGRTYPGGQPPAPDALAQLVLGRSSWWLLAACAPREVALDAEDRGVFTRWLLNGAQGPADVDDDQRLTVDELERYLLAWMPAETQDQVGSRQAPVRLGQNLGAEALLVPPGER